MQRRHFLRTVSATALVGSGVTAWAQIPDLSEAINRAGRLRMLSQRMSKCWLALAQDVEPRLAQSVLDKSQALFDKQLGELRVYAATPELKDTYTKLDTAWKEFNSQLEAKPAKGQAAVMLQADTKVLSLAHQGTVQFEAALGHPTGQLVNLAGRQRMLSQRIAKFYLASTVPVDPAAAQLEIGKARTEFIAAMDVLRSAPGSTQRIRDELKLAEGQWLFFDSAMRRPATGNPVKVMEDVFITSENLLVTMDTITGLYATLKT